MIRATWGKQTLPQSRMPGAIDVAASGFALLVLGWLSSGCASMSSNAAPKPGKGIAEYREVTRTAHASVAAVVDALGALPAAAPSSRLARFDRAFHQLEVSSVKARARAEAIIARGEAYFDEWKGHLAGITNQTKAGVETDRFNALHRHFEQVRQRSGEVRKEFGPFMAALREFRAALDPDPAVISTPASQSRVGDLAARGRRVLQALDSVAAALDEAEAEMRKTTAAKP
jgi:hypothetical protein